MQVFKPIYFDSFRCIAGQCPDSCCKEWDVQVDEASAALYRSLPGELGEQLRSVLKEEDGETVMTIIDGRCPMWRDDGLCRIQAALGHDALCHTCREFPRLTHDYGDFVEKQLELSCPEAARIILESPLSWLEKEVGGGEEPEYDPEVFSILAESRPVALALLENDAYTVPERLRLLLMYGYHVQAAIDGAELAVFDPDAALLEAAQFAGPGDIGLLAGYYRSLDLLTERWGEALGRLGEPEWDEGLCRIAQYGVCRHWFQAVSDWDLCCRVKLLLSGCALLSRLPGALQPKAQLWSKEIENSAQNLDRLLDDAYSQAALTDANLLGLLG